VLDEFAMRVLAPHLNRPRLEINVPPAQREDLPLPHAGRCRDLDHNARAARGDLE
jgi:hypothetical protein